MSSSTSSQPEYYKVIKINEDEYYIQKPPDDINICRSGEAIFDINGKQKVCTNNGIGTINPKNNLIGLVNIRDKKRYPVPNDIGMNSQELNNLKEEVAECNKEKEYYKERVPNKDYKSIYSLNKIIAEKKKIIEDIKKDTKRTDAAKKKAIAYNEEQIIENQGFISNLIYKATLKEKIEKNIENINKSSIVNDAVILMNNIYPFFSEYRIRPFQPDYRKNISFFLNKVSFDLEPAIQYINNMTMTGISEENKKHYLNFIKYVIYNDELKSTITPSTNYIDPIRLFIEECKDVNKFTFKPNTEEEIKKTFQNKNIKCNDFKIYQLLPIEIVKLYNKNINEPILTTDKREANNENFKDFIHIASIISENAEYNHKNIKDITIDAIEYQLTITNEFKRTITNNEILDKFVEIMTSVKEVFNNKDDVYTKIATEIKTNNEKQYLESQLLIILKQIQKINNLSNYLNLDAYITMPKKIDQTAKKIIDDALNIKKCELISKIKDQTPEEKNFCQDKPNNFDDFLVGIKFYNKVYGESIVFELLKQIKEIDTDKLSMESLTDEGDLIKINKAEYKNTNTITLPNYMTKNDKEFISQAYNSKKDNNNLEDFIKKNKLGEKNFHYELYQNIDADTDNSSPSTTEKNKPGKVTGRINLNNTTSNEPIMPNNPTRRIDPSRASTLINTLNKNIMDTREIIQDDLFSNNKNIYGSDFDILKEIFDEKQVNPETGKWPNIISNENKRLDLPILKDLVEIAIQRINSFKNSNLVKYQLKAFYKTVYLPVKDIDNKDERNAKINEQIEKLKAKYPESQRPTQTGGGKKISLKKKKKHYRRQRKTFRKISH